MKTALAVGIMLLLAGVGSFIFVRKEHRDSALESARTASTALAAAGEEVRFTWERESCPPENSGLYTEWSRRLTDAKASSSRASETLGADDPNVQLLSVAILNQEMLISDRRLACLKRQGKILDEIRRAY